jgi:phage-related protein
VRARVAGETPLIWVGASKRDLLSFPRTVQDGIGTALSVAQFGGKHPAAKPWKGLAHGVLEIVEDYDGNAYRALYTVRFKEVIYVLHCFQKKSHRGRETPKRDVELLAHRLALAVRDYEERYGRA